MSSPDGLLHHPNTHATCVTRRSLLACGAALTLLAACGFSPAYAPGGSGERLRGRIRLQAPATPDDFAFNSRMIERLGEGSGLNLGYRLTLAVTPQAVTPDDVTTRYALNGGADYRLTDPATGRVLAEGRVSAFSAYGASGTTVATVASEADARARLAAMLADQIVTRLIAAPIP